MSKDGERRSITCIAPTAGGPFGTPDRHAIRDRSSGEGLFATELLSPRERHVLASAALPVRTVKAGAELVGEGGSSNQLFVVTEGFAYRHLTSRNGRLQTVALVLPGEVANLYSLMSSKSMLGVRALTPVKLISVPCGTILELLEQHAGISKLLIRLALKENSILSQWSFCLGQMSAGQRLSHLFCELALRLCGKDLESATFPLPLTQEQLSAMLGLTAVHVNRTMQQLRSEGLIITAGRVVTVPNVQRLRAKAQFSPAYLHVDDAANDEFVERIKATRRAAG